MSITYRNEIPYLEEQNLVELTNSMQTPFYVYSQKNISDTFLRLKKSLNKDIYFAIKANSNQAIIALLNSLGAGADVVSHEEMQRALTAGVPPERIVFEGVGKSKSDISSAIDNNIRQINVESIEELQLVNTIADSLNKKPRVGLRVNPDINAETLDKIATGKKTDKFGIDFDQLYGACEILKSLKNIKFAGLSCHIGSQILQINIFERIFKKMKQAVKIFQSNNLPIDHLDLGGGFGIAYNNTQNQLDINKLAMLIDDTYPNPSFKISCEPGRYLVASAGYLITKILTRKKNSNINFLITDAGMQTLLRPAMYNASHRIIPFNQKGNETTYTIAGPICESSDILAKDIKLPAQTKDNYLIICDVGAYGSVMASNYNSKCLPAEVLVNQNKYAVIRHQEIIEDVINRDKLPDWLKIT